MLQENDLVLLYYDEHRNFLIPLQNNVFHTDKGTLDLREVIGKKDFGDCVLTNLNEPCYLLRPVLYDLVMKVKRQTQIMYPKDIGIILMKNHIYPGARVIEVGCGSGALTTALAYHVRPSGKVYAYEKREEFVENARKNVKKNGLEAWVEFKHTLVTDRFDENEADFIMIDMPTPWELIPAAYASLKSGCSLSLICPTFDQLIHSVSVLKENKFTHIETLEVFTRRILVREGRTRPEQRIPSHTGFLVFAVKVNELLLPPEGPIAAKVNELRLPPEEPNSTAGVEKAG